MGVVLTGKMTFWGDKYLTKVDHAMKIGILNIQAPVRMTPCPPRLQLQTLWMGVILMGFCPADELVIKKILEFIFSILF